MHFSARDAPFTHEPLVLPSFLYRVEASRGYASVGDTWSPGFWTAPLREGDPVVV